MKIVRRIRLLPLLIVVAGLAFTVRVGDFVTGLSNMGTAFAQQEVSAEPPPLPDRPRVEKEEEPSATADSEAEDKMADDYTNDAAMAEMAQNDGADTAAQGGPSILDLPGEDIDWRDATESEYQYSEVERDVYKELAARRKALDERAKSLTQQAALLEAAQREIDRKLRELRKKRAFKVW